MEFDRDENIYGVLEICKNGIKYFGNFRDDKFKQVWNSIKLV